MLLSILSRRNKKSPDLFCSQWHERLFYEIVGALSISVEIERDSGMQEINSSSLRDTQERAGSPPQKKPRTFRQTSVLSRTRPRTWISVLSTSWPGVVPSSRSAGQPGHQASRGFAPARGASRKLFRKGPGQSQSMKPPQATSSWL